MSGLIRLQVIAIVAAFCVVFMMSQAEANPVNKQINGAATDAVKADATTVAPQESTSQSSTTEEDPICGSDRQPCGWAVYGTSGNKGKIQYYIKNKCKCQKETQKCLLDGDDLSLSAWVYRCKNRSNPQNA